MYPAIESTSLYNEQNVILPHKKSDGLYPSQDVIQNKASLVIADGSKPSIGLGIEMCWAHTYGVPIIGIYQEGTELSSSFLYLCRETIVYKDKEDLTKKLNEFYEHPFASYSMSRFWNEASLMNEIDNYFENKTKQEILQDIEDSGSLLFIEEEKEK